MIQDLFIVQRRKPHLFTEPEGAVWSTCLRSLAFTPQAALSGDEVFTQQQAYRFLLEVICGLHSPIVGETEVVGQFKVFSREWVKADPKRTPLVQKLLNDAKAIRSRYLSHLGIQSYGSWVRKNLACQRVHILGAGVLTREILPYLQKNDREVVLHVRDQAKVDFYTGPVHDIHESRFDYGAVLIAAPLSSMEIERWLGPLAPIELFDLRDISGSDPIRVAPSTRHYLLQTVFKEIEQTKNLLQPRLADVQREINERSEKAASHSILRPQGWDDICA